VAAVTRGRLRGPRRGERSIGVVLKRAEQAMVRAKTTALKPVGLTLAQYVALAELERQPGITGAALARASLVSPQAMMVVLKSLEDQGLIARVPHPRHPNVLELHLSDAGREALGAARPPITAVERRILGAFSAEELDGLAALLVRWTAALEAG
jgi:DNA-binding MarR family transcriptional regulator